jgi:SNF family Na+-dependent transporter
MEVLGLFFLALTLAGITLFIIVLSLLVSLYKKIKIRNPRLALHLKIAIGFMLAIPVGLYIYQSIADSQYRDTNDTWLMITMVSPFVLLGIAIVLGGVHLYLKFTSKD